MLDHQRTTLIQPRAVLFLAATVILLLLAIPATTCTGCSRNNQPAASANGPRVFVTFIEPSDPFVYFIDIHSSESTMHIINSRTGEVVLTTPLNTLNPESFIKELQSPAARNAIAAHPPTSPDSDAVLTFTYSDTRDATTAHTSASAEAVDALIASGVQSLKVIKSELQRLPKLYRRY
jgi:hypothetical protein